MAPRLFIGGSKMGQHELNCRYAGGLGARGNGSERGVCNLAQHIVAADQ